MKKKIVAQLLVADEKLLFDGAELQFGDWVEVLVVDETGAPQWIETELQYSSDGDWFAVGILGYQLSGLIARKEAL